MPQDINTPSSPLIDAPALAKILSCSARTLTSWVKDGRLPAPVNVGRLRLWRKTDIEQVLNIRFGE